MEANPKYSSLNRFDVSTVSFLEIAGPCIDGGFIVDEIIGSINLLIQRYWKSCGTQSLCMLMVEGSGGAMEVKVKL